MRDTAIEWCDSTLNLQAGCDGCELWNKKAGVRYCYAGQMVERWAGRSGGLPAVFEKPEIYPRRLAEIFKWPTLRGVDRPGKPWLNGLPRVVFLDDMGDTFTESLPLDWLASPALVCPSGHVAPLVQLVAGRAVCSAAGCGVSWSPSSYLDALGRSPHVFVMLTKRPRRLLEFSRLHELPPNVWPGTSVTSQQTAKRLDDLVAVRGGGPLVVSAEPLLSAVDLGRWLTPRAGRRIRWVIAGGESGPGARGCNVQWIRYLLGQCRAAGVAFFCKQLGAKPFYQASAGYQRTLPGFKLSVQAIEVESTIALESRKGANPAEWPEDLRVRELPGLAA